MGMSDAACLDGSDSRRRAGGRLSAWLADAEPVISQADRWRIAALMAGMDPQDHLRAELAKSAKPLMARELAQRLCQVEGQDWQDRRLMTDGTRRVGCALRKMRAARVVEGERTQAGQVWRTMAIRL